MKKQKVHSLTGRITSQLMSDAFKAVKRNRGVSGVDKVSIQMFEGQLDQNLTALMKVMKDRTYSPSPLKRVFIPKGKDSVRPLGIPSVRDRVAQEVIRRLLDPIFEPMFHDCSFGFRKYRNAHLAIMKLKEFHAEGFSYVMDADIKAFFDNISHKLIMKLLASEIADGNILTIVEKFLSSGVMEDGKLVPTLKGTPQGGVISPLLANIVLNELDWFCDYHNLKFVRYADDFVIVGKSHAEMEKALELVSKFLENELGLSLSSEKTKITSFKGRFDFLGFNLSPQTARMRDKSVEKFKNKVRDLTVRHNNLDADVIVKLNRVIRGTVNYFATSFSSCHGQFIKLDKWLRLRVRCMKLKRISRSDNFKMRNRAIYRLGLFSMVELYSVVKEQRCLSPA
jgi:group II intron reverse transcriptase/maturase